jgi:hypothetical protein
MPAVDEMEMVAARQSDLTYYGRQRCAAGWGYCRVGGASLQEVGGSAECRAVMFNNWLTTMKDSSGPGVKAQEDPLRDR